MVQPGWEWEKVSPDIPDSGDMEQRGVSSLLGTARSTSSALSCPSAALLWPICHDLGGDCQIKISKIKLFILMEEENHSRIFQVIHGLNKISGFYGFINNKNAIRWQPCHTSLLCLWQSYMSYLQTHWSGWASHICPLKDHWGSSILLRRPFQNLPPPATGKHLQISSGNLFLAKMCLIWSPTHIIL